MLRKIFFIYKCIIKVNVLFLIKVENDWPFKDFINTLLKDLFNTKWEIRHGAATAIREIIKHHGRGAGKACNLPSDQVCLINIIFYYVYTII